MASKEVAVAYDWPLQSLGNVFFRRQKEKRSRHENKVKIYHWNKYYYYYFFFFSDLPKLRRSNLGLRYSRAY